MLSRKVVVLTDEACRPSGIDGHRRPEFVASGSGEG
jgi:hypothetical protein